MGSLNTPTRTPLAPTAFASATASRRLPPAHLYQRSRSNNHYSMILEMACTNNLQVQSDGKFSSGTTLTQTALRSSTEVGGSVASRYSLMLCTYTVRRYWREF